MQRKPKQKPEIEKIVPEPIGTGNRPVSYRQYEHWYKFVIPTHQRKTYERKWSNIRLSKLKSKKIKGFPPNPVLPVNPIRYTYNQYVSRFPPQAQENIPQIPAQPMSFEEFNQWYKTSGEITKEQQAMDLHRWNSARAYKSRKVNRKKPYIVPNDRYRYYYEQYLQRFPHAQPQAQLQPQAQENIPPIPQGGFLSPEDRRLMQIRNQLYRIAETVPNAQPLIDALDRNPNLHRQWFNEVQQRDIRHRAPKGRHLSNILQQGGYLQPTRQPSQRLLSNLQELQQPLSVPQPRGLSNLLQQPQQEIVEGVRQPSPIRRPASPVIEPTYTGISNVLQSLREQEQIPVPPPMPEGGEFLNPMEKRQATRRVEIMRPQATTQVPDARQIDQSERVTQGIGESHIHPANIPTFRSLVPSHNDMVQQVNTAWDNPEFTNREDCRKEASARLQTEPNISWPQHLWETMVDYGMIQRPQQPTQPTATQPTATQPPVTQPSTESQAPLESQNQQPTSFNEPMSFEEFSEWYRRSVPRDQKSRDAHYWRRAHAFKSRKVNRDKPNVPKVPDDRYQYFYEKYLKRFPTETQLPATQLPATQLPATQLPATQLPATQLPATQLPAIQPQATQPSTESQGSQGFMANILPGINALGERIRKYTPESVKDIIKNSPKGIQNLANKLPKIPTFEELRSGIRGITSGIQAGRQEALNAARALGGRVRETQELWNSIPQFGGLTRAGLIASTTAAITRMPVGLRNNLLRGGMSGANALLRVIGKGGLLTVRTLGLPGTAAGILALLYGTDIGRQIRDFYWNRGNQQDNERRRRLIEARRRLHGLPPEQQEPIRGGYMGAPIQTPKGIYQPAHFPGATYSQIPLTQQTIPGEITQAAGAPQEPTTGAPQEPTEQEKRRFLRELRSRPEEQKDKELETIMEHSLYKDDPNTIFVEQSPEAYARLTPLQKANYKRQKDLGLVERSLKPGSPYRDGNTTKITATGYRFENPSVGKNIKVTRRKQPSVGTEHINYANISTPEQGTTVTEPQVDPTAIWAENKRQQIREQGSLRNFFRQNWPTILATTASGAAIGSGNAWAVPFIHGGAHIYQSPVRRGPSYPRPGDEPPDDDPGRRGSSGGGGGSGGNPPGGNQPAGGNQPGIATGTAGSDQSVFQLPRYTPQQQFAQQGLMQQGVRGLAAGVPFEFEPTRQRALRQFYGTTVPTLAERFTALGSGAQSTRAFGRTLGEAGSDLQAQLAQQQQQYLLQQQGLLQNLLGYGMQPQFESYVVPGSEAQPPIINPIRNTLGQVGGQVLGILAREGARAGINYIGRRYGGSAGSTGATANVTGTTGTDNPVL